MKRAWRHAQGPTVGRQRFSCKTWRTPGELGLGGLLKQSKDLEGEMLKVAPF